MKDFALANLDWCGNDSSGALTRLLATKAMGEGRRPSDQGALVMLILEWHCNHFSFQPVGSEMCAAFADSGHEVTPLYLVAHGEASLHHCISSVVAQR